MTVDSIKQRNMPAASCQGHNSQPLMEILTTFNMYTQQPHGHAPHSHDLWTQPSVSMLTRSIQEDITQVEHKPKLNIPPTPLTSHTPPHTHSHLHLTYNTGVDSPGVQHGLIRLHTQHTWRRNGRHVQSFAHWKQSNMETAKAWN